MHARRLHTWATCGCAPLHEHEGGDDDGELHGWLAEVCVRLQVLWSGVSNEVEWEMSPHL